MSLVAKAGSITGVWVGVRDGQRDHRCCWVKGADSFRADTDPDRCLCDGTDGLDLRGLFQEYRIRQRIQRTPGIQRVPIEPKLMWGWL